MAVDDRKDWMRGQARAGRMSRRDFIQLSLAAGLSLSAADVAFAAAVSVPKRGGTFKMAVAHGAPKDSLDPATWSDMFMADVGQCVGSCLTAVDQRNIAQIDLADAFEPSDGAKTWMFKLRKGVSFHNGKPLTAEDVVATYNHHRDEKSKSAIRSMLAGIAAIKADGAEKVIFSLHQADADFPYLTSDHHLPIFAAKDGKLDFASGAGTGPFVLEKFEPGVKFTARRNPNYFNQDAPWFDAIELQSIPDLAARENALIAGQVHYADRMDPRNLGAIRKRKDLRTTEVTGFGHYVATMNTTTKPFDDVNVRQAFKFAINRDELVKRVLNGYGVPGDDVPLAPAIRFATQPEPKYHYDPERAKSLLKAAGLNGLKIDLFASDAAFPGAVDAAMLIKASAKKAGFDINVVREAAETYWDTVWMKKPLVMSYWGGRPTADAMFSAAYAADAVWNDSFWRNARFNELLALARAETDDKKRLEMYTEMQQIVHDDGGVAVLAFNTFVSGYSAKVAHGDLNSNSDHDGGQIFQRWWMV